jgi:hypothetical protein
MNNAGRILDSLAIDAYSRKFFRFFKLGMYASNKVVCSLVFEKSEFFRVA